MSDVTPHLGLPLIAAGQAQKHVTHNEALGLLDALVQLACLDKDLAVPPASPAEGDRYLVTAAAPTGAWAGLSGQVVRFADGVWAGSAPARGWFAYVIDEADLYVFTGRAWTSFRAAITAIQLTDRLGINTGADATNRLAVKADAALFSWDEATPGTGSMRVAVNKQVAGRDAGLVFQTGYAARALLGTLGSDDFSLKVSGDGAGFSTAFTAAAATGAVAFPASPTAPTPVARDGSTRLATTAYADRGDDAATARTQVADAAYAIQPADRTVAVTALTAPRVLTLPAASAFPPGARLTVLDESGACSAANAVTIARGRAADAINGLASVSLGAPYGYLGLQSNGANKWTVVDQSQVWNRRTFVDVALASGSATAGASFTRIPLPTVNLDPGGNWDAANSWYTCPRTGIYQITGSLRVGPGGNTASEPSYQYGLGVYTAEQDGPWFLWHFTPPGTAIRSTYPYARLSHQNAGDRLRMFTYSDQGVVLNAAGLQICLVSDAA